MEARGGSKEFKTWPVEQFIQPAMAYPPQVANPFTFIFNLLNDDSVKKFYDNEVLAVKEYKLKNYSDPLQIKIGFESCDRVNDPHLDLSKLKDAVFYILRSTCDDDIHKAIKYSYWTSTHKTNTILNETFRICQKKGIPLFLVFTVVNSKQFCGVAEMKSEVNFKQIFNYWWEDVKWSGVFKLKWVFIKDVHHEDVRNISDGGTSIVQMKDGSRVSFESGMKLLRYFQESEFISNIFEAFDLMDEREEKLRIKRDGFYEVIRQLKAKGAIGPVEPNGNKARRGGKRFGRGEGGGNAEYIPKNS